MRPTLLLVLLVRFEAGRFPGVGGRSRSAGAVDGQPAPDFTLNLLDGAPFRLAAQRGHPVVLNFWASWCVPCREEMPAFERSYRTYRDRGVRFVGVAIHDDPASAQAFLAQLGITYAAGLDEGDVIGPAYRIIGLPTTIFIDPTGKVAHQHTGAVNEDQLKAFIEEIVP